MKRLGGSTPRAPPHSCTVGPNRKGTKVGTDSPARCSLPSRSPLIWQDEALRGSLTAPWDARARARARAHGAAVK